MPKSQFATATMTGKRADGRERGGGRRKRRRIRRRRRRRRRRRGRRRRRRRRRRRSLAELSVSPCVHAAKKFDDYFHVYYSIKTKLNIFGGANNNISSGRGRICELIG